tara:strand:+ start:1746 stop:2507 length:762 start_codon:yes stop_codon:yes gene_type:complete
MSLTNKTVANTYKDLLHLDNSNSGITAAGKTVKDGDGTSSCLALGTNKITVRPSANSTSTVVIQNQSGDALLKVDGTNSLVSANVTQKSINTQYLRFIAKSIDIDSGTHIGVSINPDVSGNITFGNSADPAAPAINNNGDDWVHFLHYVDTNITVDSVNILVGGTAATGDSLNFHLCNLATGDSTTIDEWSSTTIVADQSSFTTTSGYEQFYRIPLDIQSANVDAGNYLALTIEGDGTSSDYSVNALVRYHLR